MTFMALRADIQALRAIAVLAVLFFHLWPMYLRGGYVGVDVFFVISGFLITSQLLREFDTAGNIRLGRFWARRARRLLPGALLVLLVTAVAVIVLVPANRWAQFLGETAASALYVENWYLAAQAVDYLGAENDPSPVQHYWTLSAEEQFYVLLPLVIIAVAFAVRKVGRSALARRVLLIVIAVLTATSFGYGLWLSYWSESAYFSTFTRAWEFAAGSLLAFAPALPRGGGTLALLGLAAIGASTLLLTSETVFPGYAALLPVLGTVAVIAGRADWLERIGAFPPIALLGRTSYALYLWHWPPIVILPFVLGAPLSAPWKLGIIAATVLIAWAATRFWEDPIRFSPRLLAGKRPLKVAAWSAAGMAIVLVVSLAAPVVHRQQEAAAAEAAQEAIDSIPEECLGAAAMANGCDDIVLPVFYPSLSELSDDDDNRGECWDRSRDGPAFNLCVIGPETGYDKHFIVLGDSHSNVFIGVYAQLAEERNWRFDVAGHTACYLTAVRLVKDSATGQGSCDYWRESAMKYIATTEADALIVTHSTGTNAEQTRDGQTREEAAARGMVEAWGMRLSPETTPVIAIRDNPRLLSVGVDCLERVGPARAIECAVPRAEALAHDTQIAAVEAAENAHLIDFTDLYCTKTLCPWVIGGVVAYRNDGQHLSATFARTLTPYVAQELAAIVG